LNLIEKWQVAYRKGFAKPIILSILYNEAESYPYRITKQISEKTFGQLTIAPSNIYPILKELVDDGLIDELGIEERRIIYRINHNGKAFFKDLSNHLCEFLLVMQKNFEIGNELKENE
jgi:DNA-binding PadR family transcriptional regulator